MGRNLKNERRLHASDMREGTCKVEYKTDSGEEFYVVANPDMLSKWQQDKSVPMVDVVQSYDIFTSPSGGNIFPADRPSKSQLENVFNSSHADDVVKMIIERGTPKNF